MRHWQARVIGGTFCFAGDITSNTWVGARDGAPLERSLGFAPGRLAAGWSVLVLKEPPLPEDFRFAGLTLRSGGRAGLPAADALIDRSRRHVSDEIIAERGAAGYRKLQQWALGHIHVTGDDRLVKVMPVTAHDPDMAPSAQYPMGGGGLQWTLVRPKRFLVAMTVDGFGVARIPGFCTLLHAHMPYDDRARLARHIRGA
jgi:hypothetical protein